MRRKVSNDEMHPLVCVDLWQLGKSKFAKKDVLQVRKDWADRRTKKGILRKCVMTSVEEMKEKQTIDFSEDVNYVPSWQRKLRSIPNNLFCNRK